MDHIRLEESVGPGNARVLGRWVVVRIPGPFADEAAVLHALGRAVGGLERALRGEAPGLATFLQQKRRGVCSRLRQPTAESPESC